MRIPKPVLLGTILALQLLTCAHAEVPVVTWVRPTNGAVLGAGTAVALRASATVSNGTIDLIDFLAGTNLLGRLSAPLPSGATNTFQWSNAPAGTFLLHAEAVDNLGNRGTSAVVQIVLTNTPGASNLPPVVAWVSPTNGSVLPAGSRVLLTVNVSDPNENFTAVEFLAGTNLLQRRTGLLTNGVYYYNWSNPPPGTVQLRATAADNFGARATSAVQIVFAAASNLPPVVNWLRPTNGSVVAPGQPVFLTANVTDSDGTINYVEFFAAQTYLGRGVKVITNSNYNLTWTNPPVGIFQMRAVAVDNAGDHGTSAPVRVFVGAAADVRVDLGTVEVPTIGHAVVSTNMPPPQNQPWSVVDFLIDQNQSSGGGGLLPPASVNWDTNFQFKLTVSAPPGMKFLVTVPTGRAVRFGGYLIWESTGGGVSPLGQVAASFMDVEGTAPAFNLGDSVLSETHGFFGFNDLTGTEVSNSFAFTSITLTGTVEPQYTGNGTEDYLPQVESSMYLSYGTSEPGEPESFIALVPAGPLPKIQMVGLSPETGARLVVFGRPTRTHIVECSPDTSSWRTIASGVMPPAGSMPINDAAATTDRSRYYRVVELP
jgi:hypothetical protein